MLYLSSQNVLNFCLELIARLRTLKWFGAKYEILNEQWLCAFLKLLGNC